MPRKDLENQNGMDMEESKKIVMWKDVEKVLVNDDSRELEELIKAKGFSAVLRPEKAPRDQTIFHKAVENQNISCLNILIKKSESIFHLDYPDYNGDTPLICAATSGFFEGVELLLNSLANINARNNLGNSILHEIVISLRNSIEEEKHKEGFTEKSKEIEGQKKIMQCLDIILNKNDCDFEARNIFGLTPIYTAAEILPIKDGLNKAKVIIEFCQKLAAKGADLTTCDKNRSVTAKELFERKKVISNILEKQKTISNVRPFVSQYIDIFLLGQCSEYKSEIFKGKSTDDIIGLANSMVGSHSILFYVVDKCDVRAVRFLLQAGANSWKKQPFNQLCIHQAFARGNLEILEILLEYMKKANNSDEVDLTENSFYLLEIFFTNAKNSQSAEYEEYFKCFKRLLSEDVKVNINDRERKTHQTILHLAAKYNNQEVLQMLIEKGAFIGSRSSDNIDQDDKNIFDVLSLDSFLKSLDNCIRHQKYHSIKNDIDNENVMGITYTLDLNYRFLVPPTEIFEFNEVKTLREIGQSKFHNKALTHPILQTFIYAKWRKARPFFYINLATYALFVIFLTLFMYSLTDLRMIEEAFNSTANATSDPELISTNNSSTNLTLKEDYDQKSKEVISYMSILVPLTFYIFLRELFQLVCTFSTYKKDFENYVEWIIVIIVIILTTATVPVDLTRHLAAWGMIIAWYEFVFILGRVPSLSIYVTMLRHVSLNFLKLLALFGALILAFSVSFNIILRPSSQQSSDSSFTHFWSTVPQAIVMATGEFEYSSLSGKFFTPHIFYSISAVLIFLVFLFLIFLVLMNVLNGLAVNDTQEIMEQATLHSLISRLELIYLIEKMIMTIPHFSRLLHKIFGFSKNIICNYSNPRLLIKVNERDKGKRIVYGDDEQHCKLSSTTTNLLRSYWLKLMQEKEEKAKPNELAQCLSLLQELKAALPLAIPAQNHSNVVTSFK